MLTYAAIVIAEWNGAPERTNGRPRGQAIATDVDARSGNAARVSRRKLSRNRTNRRALAR
jgi:hypothetical protein